MNRIVNFPPALPPFADGAVRGGWWRETGEGQGQVVCELCPRECRLRPGDRGFCFVRENRDGEMALTTYGRSTGFCIDPIEKKPLNHFLPGTSVLSFGTAGCNLGCRFCQNWDISKSREIERLSESAGPEAIANAAAELGCRSVAFTYNDPVIWAEYALDVAAACRERQVKTVAVTAGYLTDAARPAFFQGVDAANIDLKGFSESFYHQLTASHLQPVLDTLVYLKQETDVWFEITNLVIPDANDSDDELRRMCQWIVERLGTDVPIHFSAFHPDFRMRDRPATPHSTLLRARQLAIESGIQFAYVGNVDDAERQSTYCAACGELLIERNWYALGRYRIRRGKCASCGVVVPGCFEDEPGDWGRRRQPVAMQRFAGPAVVRIGGNRGAGPPADKDVPDALADSSSQRQGAALSLEPASTEFAVSDAQQQAARIAVWEVVSATAAGREPTLSDPSLAGAAETVVEGVFTTLKRGDMLRGCCGAVGRPLPLREALPHAARRTTSDDPRMPPVTTRELPFLSLDISLLHSFEPLSGDAAARRSQIQLGRHGLQIRRGGQAGLLLPGVPEEHGWDLDTFLRQICRKAGLPTTAWEDPATQLVRFQAIVSQGPLAPGSEGTPPPAAKGLLTESDMRRLQLHCRGNIEAHASGATPSFYLTGCPDGEVQGVALTVRDVSGGPLVVSEFSLRPGLPLQSTLYTLTERAAQRLRLRTREAGGAANELGEVDVFVFADAAMHGVASAADLRGFAPESEAVVVQRQGRTGWAAGRSLEAERLLQRAVEAGGIRRPETAMTYSLRLSRTGAGAVTGGDAPSPTDAGRCREPAVAGAFYPSDARDAGPMLQAMFNQRPAAPQTARAVMTPHAGWKYSGRIAAGVLGRVKIPQQVIVIGPKHTPLGVDWAVAPHDSWSVPGGRVAADRRLAGRLAAAVPGWQLDAAAHEREHCVEVELPLLHWLRPDVQVTGVALAGGSWEEAADAARALAGVLREMEAPPLLVISSDMNHFATDAENRRLDAIALEAMQSADGRALLDTCRRHSISMCGVFPAAIVLQTLRELGGDLSIEQTAYATSADVTGDKSRVVGYAGMILS